MGLKKWLDFSSSGQRRPSSAPLRERDSAGGRGTGGSAAARAGGGGGKSSPVVGGGAAPPGAGHRRHASLPPPRVASHVSDAGSSSAALRSSSVGQASDALERGGTAFETALQVAPGDVFGDAVVADDAEQKAARLADLDEGSALGDSPTHVDTDLYHQEQEQQRRRRASSAGSARSSSQAPQPPAARGGLMESLRFSWHNVLGHSSRSESGAPPDADEGVAAADGALGVVMQGWLEKCGQQFKTWNWRFFVLRDDGVLSYYTDESMRKLKGSLLVGAGSRADISVQSNMLEKTCVFMIATPQRNTMISAPSQRLMTKWIAKLHAAGATPSEPWDPLKKTVKFFVRDAECPHEWKRYDDPTSYIHMEGCLLKRGHVHKSWKTRFFRIEKGELRYYTENQETLKGAVALKGTVVSPGMAQCSDGRKYYFVLTSRDGKFEMHLNAFTESSMHRWIEAIQEAQTALGRTLGGGAKDTVAGLALVVKRAEEVPLARLEVSYAAPRAVSLTLERRTEALVVARAPAGDVPVGAQLVAVAGRSVLRESHDAARARLRAAPFPLALAFVAPPFKKGLLVKKSRSGLENWKRRVLVVANGEVHYYKQLAGSGGAPPTLKHRKSFSLVGCYLNLVQFPGRPLCIVVARSPSDKLVLQTSSEDERIEWASVLYCSIRMVSQGITSGHIANLHLETARERRGAAVAQDMRAERSSTV